MKLSDILNGRWIKHPAPVLCPGKQGDWDDLMADCPSIFSDEPEKYYLYYTGHSTKAHKWSIGLAESRDLFNWTKYANNPILTSAEPGSWDQRIDGATVFKHDTMYYLFYEATKSLSLGQSRIAFFIPYPMRKRLGTFKRWLNSMRQVPASQAAQHATGRCIGLASSDNKINWIKHSDNPILMPSEGNAWDSCGVLSPAVQLINGVIYMFYGGSDGQRICSGAATSKDLYQWEKFESPILIPGIEGAWDDSSVLIVSVIKLEDAYCAFYEGQDRNNNYGIGIAYSYDLLKWKKFDKNPILSKDRQGELGERLINSPHAFIEGERVFIFYGAHDFKMKGHSMVAYLTHN